LHIIEVAVDNYKSDEGQLKLRKNNISVAEKIKFPANKFVILI